MKQIFFTIILLLCLYYVFSFLVFFKKNKLKYYRFNNDATRNLPLNKTIEDVFNTYDINTASVPQEADILFLEKFDHQHIFKYISMLANYENKYLYTIVSIDFLSSKSKLYDMMRNNIDEKSLHEVFPKSFLTDNEKDIIKLKNEILTKNKLIILKKNIQQQKGCKIISKDTFNEKELKEYVIAQELLQNPFLIENRKINIRIYILISVNKNQKFNVYMYNDGFMYYTSQEYKANTICPHSNITTGYIDRSIYERNPLTMNDFRNHIGYDKTRIFNENIIACFKTIFKTLKKTIVDIEADISLNKFVIMGADVAVDEDLGIKLMEINKGPDLRYKDERDGKVKFKMVRDTFYELGLLNDKSIKSNYIKII